MSNITRRDFLRVTLSSTAVAALGCSKAGSITDQDVDSSQQDTAVDQPPANAGADSGAGEIGICAFFWPMYGWLACDGSKYKVSEYPELFAAIGTIYGGDGTQDFRVPDLRGRALCGSSETLPLGGQTSRIDPYVDGEDPAFKYSSSLFVISTGQY